MWWVRCSKSHDRRLCACSSCTWRSLETIQTIAVGGKFQGKLKPFQNLLVGQLRQELSARSQFDVSKSKPLLGDDLHKCLKGVQRVPTLLIGQPPQPLSQCHLSAY